MSGKFDIGRTFEDSISAINKQKRIAEDRMAEALTIFVQNTGVAPGEIEWYTRGIVINGIPTDVSVSMRIKVSP